VIAVDTNVLLRLLVGDEPAQAARARQLFDRADADQTAVWVSDTVLVELAWTLARAYGRDRADIVKALRALSSHATVSLESADCMLCAKAVAAGCDQVATFDRGMKTLPAVRLL
jgi:predicted nucleic acid-binding protein